MSTDSGGIAIGAWTRLVEYPNNHLNDFCIFRGLDGRWHAIGIMGTGGAWESEISFFHCSCEALLGRYEVHPPLLADLAQGASDNASLGKHAPFVVVHEGLHHLFFRRPYGTNLYLASADVFAWPSIPEVVFEERDARDACILRFGRTWHWYYVQHHPGDGVERSCVMLRTGRDLHTWSAARPVFVDRRREVRHSRLESPVVVAHSGCYWLFVRDRLREDARHPAPVAVYRSSEPTSFPDEPGPLAVFPDVQAPEIVEDAGRLFIVRVSGAPHAAPAAPADHGWLEAAELHLPGDGPATTQDQNYGKKGSKS